MTPVACPFPNCGRYAGHVGRCTPTGLTPPPPTSTAARESDRCYLRRDGTCGRVDHPTTRSTCRQETTRGR